MKKLTIFLILFLMLPIKISAARGCCSRHGGVAGCNEDGRQICKDGTLSPTCTCTPVKKYVYGCTDKSAKNYNANADKDNGTCQYYVYGCTDKNAINYNVNAEKNDGSCKYYIYGCTDSAALNYNSQANKDDGSCEYKKVEETTMQTMNSVNEEQNNSEESEDSDIFSVFGLGGGALGVYMYKKSKRK